MHRFAKAYELLELPPTASLDEVKRAYRKLAMRYHPDLNTSADAAQRFIQINKAYEVIVYAEGHDWSGNVQRQSKVDSEAVKSRDRDRVRIPKAEAVRMGREKSLRFERLKLQREARQFLSFKRSIYYPWTMAMTYASVIMFVLVLLDSVLIREQCRGYVSLKEPIRQELLMGDAILGYRIGFEGGKEVEVNTAAGELITAGTFVYFSKSLFFDDVPSIEVMNSSFKPFSVNAFNKPPFYFFLMFLMVPMAIFFVDKPSALFYAAGAYARYAVAMFILTYIIF